MTPAQFKSARNALGLSVSEMAAALGVRDRTIRAYECDRTAAGAREPSQTLLMLLSLALENHNLKPEDFDCPRLTVTWPQTVTPTRPYRPLRR